MTAKENAINWFEIPAVDMSRAKKFYESVFGIELPEQEMMGMQMAFFPYEMESGKLSGALVKSNMHVPSSTGTIVYLNANPSIQAIIDKIEPAGGKITMPKTLITDEIGYMAFFTDTEGNAMALHAQQ